MFRYFVVAYALCLHTNTGVLFAQLLQSSVQLIREHASDPIVVQVSDLSGLSLFTVMTLVCCGEINRNSAYKVKSAVINPCSSAHF